MNGMITKFRETDEKRTEKEGNSDEEDFIGNFLMYCVGMFRLRKQ